MVSPSDPGFSGFVFKIQANMNPKHRDRVAFIRIVSGAFQRDMVVQHPRAGKPVRLSNSQRLFAQDRETVDTAWAGDVVGIVGNQDFQIGDTLAEDPAVRFDELPRFVPECFAQIHSSSTATGKRFREGLDQLLREGVAQAFELNDSLTRTPLLARSGRCSSRCCSIASSPSMARNAASRRRHGASCAGSAPGTAPAERPS